MSRRATGSSSRDADYDTEGCTSICVQGERGFDPTNTDGGHLEISRAHVAGDRRAARHGGNVTASRQHRYHRGRIALRRTKRACSLTGDRSRRAPVKFYVDTCTLRFEPPARRRS